MNELFLITGGVVTVLGLLLTAFFFFKKAGTDAEKVKSLNIEVKNDNETLDDLRKANEFRNRIFTDPGYLELMRREIQDQK